MSLRELDQIICVKLSGPVNTHMPFSDFMQTHRQPIRMFVFSPLFHIKTCDTFFFILQMPLRLVCTCSDATVRLLSPGSGECITTMLLPSMSIIADVAYAAAESKS